MKKHLPNLLTCCNLLSGSLGIVFVLEERNFPAAYFIWIAGVFDFFDGFAARLLKVSSPIGKELDSLADVISFGLLPAVVMYKLIEAPASAPYLPYIAFLIAVFSALRLAIFNVDESQQHSFKGLNTPANALFITSLPLIRPEIGDWAYKSGVLAVITVVFSLLLVSPLRFIAFKFKNFSWADNRIRYIFLGLTVLLLVMLKQLAIPLIIILYILLSLVNRAIGKEKTQ